MADAAPRPDSPEVAQDAIIDFVDTVNEHTSGSTEQHRPAPAVSPETTYRDELSTEARVDEGPF